MALQIVSQLLDDLNVHAIKYCHWKSNEHLEAALNGDTDLDMLFDKRQEQQVVEILNRNQFHLFEAVWYRRYKGIVDYIGFDKETGKIVHVHTHFNLDIGEVGIKSYRLPWEALILANRIFHDGFNIYKSSPETELLLLIVRTAFKHDTVDKKSNLAVSRHYNAEAEWLYNQTNPEKLKSISDKVLSKEMTTLIEKVLLNRKYEASVFIELKGLLKPYFSSQRLLSSQRVRFLKTVHLAKRIQYKLCKTLNLQYRPEKRSLPRQGIVLCLMGSDGAGKSTQTKEITRELSKKVDVKFMYMGSGDGSKSLQRKLIEAAIKFAAKQSASHKVSINAEKTEKNFAAKKNIPNQSFIKRLLLSLKAVSLAFEKKNRLKQIEKARNRGGIVVCDRYPQTSTLGYNDGPKLFADISSPNLIIRWLAKYEYNCYALAKKIYPNLVIKLTGSLDVLHARRPEMTREEINKKQNGIINLQFDPPTEVINIDVNQPINQIKGSILAALSHQISVISNAAAVPNSH